MAHLGPRSRTVALSTGGCWPRPASPWNGLAAQLTGRISIAAPDDAERRAIIGVTGVHQPAGLRKAMQPCTRSSRHPPATVSLAKLSVVAFKSLINPALESPTLRAAGVSWM